MIKIAYVTAPHLKKFLQWNGKQAELVLDRSNKWYEFDKNILRFQGFSEYNHLTDINVMFSKNPEGQPLDRTGKLHLPVKFNTGRPWTYSDKPATLRDTLSKRVKDLLDTGLKINLLWSGGIDSTTMVNAFLTNCDDHSRLRILYSPFSVYEHRDYIEKFLPKFSQVELVDISGDVYLTQQFDGMFISGDTGDETHASLDESFLEQFGYNSLSMPWKDFFYARNKDTKFLEFCEQYFSWATRPINTVLEARWWFYINSKMYYQLSTKLKFFSNYKNFKPNQLQGFYDCEEFESFITHNLHRIMPTSDYSSWKTDLKEYCVKIDGFEQWAQEKTKSTSSQIRLYTYKKMILNDQRSMFIMDDGTRISTPSQPFLIESEFRNLYGTSLDYLINDPI